MEPRLTVRPLATPDEHEWCAGLMAASEPWLTLGLDAGALGRTLARPGSESYLALLGPQRAGCLVLDLQGALVGYLRAVCVAPELRGRAWGARLLAFAEQRVFQESPNVFLCVSSFNVDARRFYERHGYEAVGELRDYLVAGLGEVLMRKTRGPIRGWAAR